ncbi:HIG1 domain-containing protein [Paraurantiacibacter namhicola]|uniref:HIG1 domain-containing protein n=1 Tax=Paraurantiacibacter namhicola TaxID=645517 RepID=A0A1C7D514_9SPHN|nr:HIG1 domain-containing protein [Paraurantiacibacter namhicola]ANU06566.1 hypothetical protein A6F65_00239 [Paraurantiacibacter namhicola]
MQTVLIIVLVFLMVMVVVALVRGIVAFLQSTKMDLEEGDERMHANQTKQNQAMFARIKYQALAIVVVAIILAMAS